MTPELLRALYVRFKYTLDDTNLLLPTSLDTKCSINTWESAALVKREIAELCPTPPPPAVTSSELSLDPPAKKQKLEGFQDCFKLATTSQHDNNEVSESTRGYLSLNF